MGRIGLYADRPSAGNQRYSFDFGTNCRPDRSYCSQYTSAGGFGRCNQRNQYVRVAGYTGARARPENMAWFTPAELPDHKYYIFGREGAKQLAEQRGLRLLGEIPVVQSICDGGDAGKPVALNADSITGTAFRQLADEVVKAVEENHDPAKRVRVTRQ